MSEILDLLLRPETPNVQKQLTEKRYRIKRLTELYGEEAVFLIRALPYGKVEELRESGLRVVTVPDDTATVVLIGFDTENTSEKIRNTCIMLGKDVAYLATNPDLVCPVSFGFIPDCGSMSIMLKNATGKEPFFIGKPQPIMVDCVLKMLKNTGISREDAVIVGDRLYTDIATGANAGVDTICVLSGEASMKDIQEWDGEPTWIFQDVKEIFQKLQTEPSA